MLGDPVKLLARYQKQAAAAAEIRQQLRDTLAEALASTGAIDVT